MIKVLKEDGVAENFDPGKVRQALRRSGMSSKEADEVLKRLSPFLFDGITTKRIYSIVYGIVEDMRPEVSHRYNLKRALQRIGPAGYEFEDFTARLLEQLGYETDVRQFVEGKCISHEIDVVARKGKDRYMIECKFRHQPGYKCRIQTALYVYARFLDLKEGAKRGINDGFTKPWLITNAKFSYDVRDYASCMGIELLGWRFPFKRGLEVTIDRAKCYPVSVIKMGERTLRRLLRAKIVTVFDIPESPQKLADMTEISIGTARQIVERARYTR
jgi:hypothetical protein